ncbi:hypothetical protein [Flavicella sediminum]|uniref:hypothetical protein n=1 Tax=Flavicella sediminum TaxID=2585141 RepID=UPI001AA0A192|nr:hypothetical protein [Flavicella sediminum]
MTLFMRTSLLVFLSFFLNFNLLSCKKNEESIDTVEPVSMDISITSSVNLIRWSDTNDLTQQLENVISYDFAGLDEDKIVKQEDFKEDMTAVTLAVAIKTEFMSMYKDSNLTNNSVTIQLEKESEETSKGIALKADGPGNTYELITSVLAPNYSPIETPDCNHSDFGKHIDEIFDADLDSNVFRFFIHTSPDNDRCQKFDRQRNEIKTYDRSPDNLLGVENEKVVYQWKFKLPLGFQSSSSFTHIHQIKSVGGDLASMPMYTLTTRKGSPDKLELRYAETDKQITLDQESLAPFLGNWVEVTETILYGRSGTYEIEIKNVKDDTVLFSFRDDAIINWRPGADFARPKWGIYRSLLKAEDLRDEELLFADFYIEELIGE